MLCTYCDALWQQIPLSIRISAAFESESESNDWLGLFKLTPWKFLYRDLTAAEGQTESERSRH